ncbi:hypothetical protein L9F63_019633 [Diploptera punctata]|uniref:Selenoprotein P N-terminal domain-containing protein n=1 Tax=Diploptera punctata TaxID=6984 RepID=A0AAD8EDQ9_DIPPU|nr:hypothetical protein L9F63_019633 [Diploptera punctata]
MKAVISICLFLLSGVQCLPADTITAIDPNAQNESNNGENNSTPETIYPDSQNESNNGENNSTPETIYPDSQNESNNGENNSTPETIYPDAQNESNNGENNSTPETIYPDAQNESNNGENFPQNTNVNDGGRYSDGFSDSDSEDDSTEGDDKEPKDRHGKKSQRKQTPNRNPGNSPRQRPSSKNSNAGDFRVEVFYSMRNPNCQSTYADFWRTIRNQLKVQVQTYTSPSSSFNKLNRFGLNTSQNHVVILKGNNIIGSSRFFCPNESIPEGIDIINTDDWIIEQIQKTG